MNPTLLLIVHQSVELNVLPMEVQCRVLYQHNLELNKKLLRRLHRNDVVVVEAAVTFVVEVLKNLDCRCLHSMYEI